MRMDPDSELTAAEVVNDWPESRIAEILRNYADERHARSIAREIVAARPLETTSELVDAVRAGVPPRSASVAATRPSAPSRPSASPSTRSSANSTPRCRRPGTCSRPAAASPAISFHSLEDRRVKRFLAERARGCICPPELPICQCGLEPEAELITRGGVAPSAGEIAQNARSASAHLRVARKLDGKSGEGI